MARFTRILSVILILAPSAAADLVRPLRWGDPPPPSTDRLVRLTRDPDWWFAEARRQITLTHSHPRWGSVPQFQLHVHLITTLALSNRLEEARAVAVSEQFHHAASQGLINALVLTELQPLADAGHFDLIASVMEPALASLTTRNADGQAETAAFLAALRGKTGEAVSALETIEDLSKRRKQYILVIGGLDRVGKHMDAKRLIPKIDEHKKAILDSSRKHTTRALREGGDVREEDLPRVVDQSVNTHDHKLRCELGELLALVGMFPEAEEVLAQTRKWRARTFPDAKDGLALLLFTQEEDRILRQLLAQYLRHRHWEKAIECVDLLPRSSRSSESMKAVRALCRNEQLEQAESLISRWDMRDSQRGYDRTLALLAVAERHARHRRRQDVERLWGMARDGMVALEGEVEIPSHGSSDPVRDRYEDLARALYAAGLIAEGRQVEAKAADRYQRQMVQRPLPEEIEEWEKNGLLRFFNPKPEAIDVGGRVTRPGLTPYRAAAYARAGYWDRVQAEWNAAHDGPERFAIAIGVAKALADLPQQGSLKDRD